jgi:hypothetical protein
MREIPNMEVRPSGVSLESALESVGPGWSALIKELYLEMMNYPGVHLTQVKEKFGMLRIYWDNPGVSEDDKNVEGKSLIPFQAFIAATENKSGKMCELCGKEGKVINENRWLKARCPEHAGHEI